MIIGSHYMMTNSVAVSLCFHLIAVIPDPRLVEANRRCCGRIPAGMRGKENGCVFRPKPATDSDASRPPVPTERGH